jgi:signal transduction histidine kinase
MRIKFVIKNLLDNAIKHKTSPQQTIDVTTQHVLQNNQHIITLRIKDYGSGIAAKHLPHLSQPFYRADPSRQRKTGGYGLGLYLVRLVIEAHGGEFLIESQAGKGTCVTLVLVDN